MASLLLHFECVFPGSLHITPSPAFSYHLGSHGFAFSMSDKSPSHSPKPSATYPFMPAKSGLRQVRLWPKVWLKTNLVVHGRYEPLTRAEIALRGFNRSVTEQELDLLQFSSSSMAQAGTRAAEVMRS